MGNAALSANDPLHCAIDRADLIINVGHDVVEKPPFFMEPDGLQVIHVNFSSASVDPVYFPQLEVIGDIGNSIWQLLLRINRQKTWDFSYFAKVKKWIDEIRAVGNDDPGFPIAPQRLVADVRRVMADDGIICLDNGVYKIWFALNYRAHEPNTVLLDNALATMGAGLPSAMAARLVEPDKQVMAICGDGGFMMNSQELETASAPRDEPRGPHSARRRLRHDQVEAGRHGLCRLGPRLRQPGFRPIRRQLWRPTGTASARPTICCRPCASASPRRASI